MSRKKRRILVGLVSLAILFLLVLGAGWIGPRALRGTIARKASEALDAEVTVGSVSGNALFGVTLRDVAVQGQPGRTLVRSASAEMIEVRYSLLGLVLGNASWLRSVEVAGVEADLDFESEIPEALRRDDEEWDDKPLVLPRIRLDAYSIHAARGDASLRLRDIGFQFDPDSLESGTGSLRTSGGEWSAAGRVRSLDPFGGRITRDGRRFAVPDLSVAGEARPGDRLEFEIPGDGSSRTVFEARLSMFGGRISADATVDPDSIVAAARLDHLDGARLRAAFPIELPAVAGTVKAGLSVEGSPDALRFEVRVDSDGMDDSISGDGYSLEGYRLRSSGTLTDVSRLDTLTRVEFLALRLGEREFLRGSVALDGGGARDDFTFAVAARAQDYSLDASARFAAPAGDAARLEIDRIEATAGATSLSAEGPVAMRFGSDGIAVSGSGIALLDGRAAVEGRISSDEIDLALRLDEVKLEDVLALVGIRDGFAGVATADLRASGSPGEPLLEGTAELREGRFRLEERGVPEVTGAGVRASFRDRSITVHALDADVAGGRVQATGSFDILEGFRPRVHEAQVRVEGVNLSALEGLVPGATGLEGVATLDLRASGTLDDPTLQVTGSLRDAAYDDLEQVNVALFGGYESGRGSIDRLMVDAPGATVSISGDLPVSIALDPPRFRIDPSDPLALSVTGGLADVESIRRWIPLPEEFPLEARGIETKLEAGGTLADPHLAATASVERVKPGDLEAVRSYVSADLADGMLRISGLRAVGEYTEVRGSLEGPVRLVADPSQPVFEIGAAEEFRGELVATCDNQELLDQVAEACDYVVASLSLADGVLGIRELGVTMGESGRLECEGSITLARNLRPDALDLRGSLHEMDLADLPVTLDPPVEGRASLEFEASGTVSHPDIHFDVRSDGARQGNARIDDFLARGIVNDSGLSLELVRVMYDEHTVTGGGTVSFPFSLDPPRADVSSESAIDFEVRGDEILVGRFIPENDWIRKIEGHASIDMEATGTLGDPGFNGAIQLEGVGIRYMSDALPRVNDLSGEILVRGLELKAEGLTGMFGREPARFDGDLTLSRNGIERFEGRVTGERLLLFSGEDIRVRAGVDLSFAGTLQESLLSGTVKITDSRFLQDLGTGGSGGSGDEVGSAMRYRMDIPRVEGEIGRAIRLDVRVTSGRPTLLDTDILRALARPNLHLTGSAADPVITGEVTLAEGTIFTPTILIEMDVGKMQFYQRDPRRPYVTFVGRSRVGGYEITINARGPVDDLDLTMTSSPPLSQEDIASLLATGVTQRALVGTGAQRAAQSQGLRLLYGRIFPRSRGREATLLSEISNRITVETLPTETYQEGGPVVRATLRLTEEDRWYLRTELDELGEYAIDLLFRIRFGKRESVDDAEEGSEALRER